MATRKSNEVVSKTVMTGGAVDKYGALSDALNGRRSPGEEKTSRQVLTGEVLEVFLDRFPEVFEAFIEGSKSAGS